MAEGKNLHQGAILEEQKMLIGKKWKLESDDMNVILSKRRTRKSKDGKSYQAWGTVGFYSTVANALKDLVNYEVRATELKDLQTVVNKIDELGKQIEQATK